MKPQSPAFRFWRVGRLWGEGLRRIRIGWWSGEERFLSPRLPQSFGINRRTSFINNGRAQEEAGSPCLRRQAPFGPVKASGMQKAQMTWVLEEGSDVPLGLAAFFLGSQDFVLR